MTWRSIGARTPCSSSRSPCHGHDHGSAIFRGLGVPFWGSHMGGPGEGSRRGSPRGAARGARGARGGNSGGGARGARGPPGGIFGPPKTPFFGPGSTIILTTRAPKWGVPPGGAKNGVPGDKKVHKKRGI